jgi:hypothetical protein
MVQKGYRSSARSRRKPKKEIEIKRKSFLLWLKLRRIKKLTFEELLSYPKKIFIWSNMLLTHDLKVLTFKPILSPKEIPVNLMSEKVGLPPFTVSQHDSRWSWGDAFQEAKQLVPI